MRALRRCLFAVLRVLLRANTGPVDALIYALALCWLLFLAVTPDRAYVSAALGRALAFKAVWVWPALGAGIATPLGWASGRRWMHRGARIYQAMWWTYLAVATLIVTPSIIVFWASALCCLIGALWLLAREGAGELAPLRG